MREKLILENKNFYAYKTDVLLCLQEFDLVFIQKIVDEEYVIRNAAANRSE